MSRDAILSLRGLQMHFPDPQGKKGEGSGVVRAVDGVDLDVLRGETLGLVGESGCGKSTLGRCVVRLYQPTGGTVHLDVGGARVDLTSLSARQMRPYRRNVQMIFQDPFASLNPRMTVRDIISEPIRVHKLAVDKAALRRRVAELMDMCGLDPRFAARYPHEFSGGQRQRIGIARALAAEPDVIVCDEPISALDVSIQAQVMNLMSELQSELGLTLLFIAHDLAAVRHISDRVAVMYLGRIVEVADAKSLYRDPQHPYTQALLSAVPVPDPVVEATRERIILTGDVPSPRNPPPGCTFHTRCPKVFDRCKRDAPTLREVDGHAVSCHLMDEAAS